MMKRFLVIFLQKNQVSLNYLIHTDEYFRDSWLKRMSNRSIRVFSDAQSFKRSKRSGRE